MKTNKLMLTLSAAILLIAGCKDKEVWVEDSPYITVSSPTKDQVLQDGDSIRINAVIEPKSVLITYYHIILLDQKHSILNSKVICKKDESKVEIDTAFTYNIKKTSDLLLQVHAQLADGNYIRDETRFKLVDSKK
ncbi:hypothetical protein [Dyadobacter crusticola]|uniref:hypothetical protein n=1 Tax=Dyadobacter crusticola TaxID=292407 RepID=UPI000B11CC57|nr:hypothetical protein [Dyadobacter crusticola]